MTTVETTTVVVTYSDTLPDVCVFAGSQGETYAAEMAVWARIDSTRPERVHRVLSVDIIPVSSTLRECV